MVCLPCIVIPLFLWIFHKFLQPFILKFWKPTAGAVANEAATDVSQTQCDTSSAEYNYVKGKIDTNPVMIFSKTTCRYSDMAKNVFNEIGVSYTVDDIDRLDNMMAVQDVFEKMTGARTVPRVFVGGKCIGGGSETWTMHNKGELLPRLTEAGATFKKTD